MELLVARSAHAPRNITCVFDISPALRTNRIYRRRYRQASVDHVLYIIKLVQYSSTAKITEQEGETLQDSLFTRHRPLIQCWPGVDGRAFKSPIPDPVSHVLHEPGIPFGHISRAGSHCRSPSSTPGSPTSSGGEKRRSSGRTIRKRRTLIAPERLNTDTPKKVASEDTFL